MVLLSRLREMAGLAKSFIQTSLLVSVRVTRGGGLKVDGAVTWPRCLRWLRTPMKMVERALRPDFCLMAGDIVILAELVSFWLPRSQVPFWIASGLQSSS
jgi:hypothetical protein